MSRILPLIALILTLSLTACADSTSTTTRRPEHAEARLGSHVPRTNAASAGQEEASQTGAGERAFSSSAPGASSGGGR